MARTKSIPKFVRDLKPAPSGKRLTVPVPSTPGLYVRVSDRAKVFTVIVRPKGAKNPKFQSIPLVLDMDHLTEAEVDELFGRFHDLVTGTSEDTDGLGKLVAFQGVSEFPARVKCASLAWHSMRAALKGSQREAVTTE